MSHTDFFKSLFCDKNSKIDLSWKSTEPNFTMGICRRCEVFVNFYCFLLEARTEIAALSTLQKQGHSNVVHALFQLESDFFGTKNSLKVILFDSLLKNCIRII